MRKLIGLLIIGFFITSCGGNKNENNSSVNSVASDKKIEKKDRKIPNNDVTENNAYVRLVNYSYKDSQDYGKSSESRTLSIEGETNLPENTNIKIEISSFIPSTKEEDANDTYGTVEVKDGKFELKLKPWNVPQTVSFRVFKDDQPSQVLKIIGESGDKMKVQDENKGEYSSICFFREKVNINEQLITSLKSGKAIEYKFQTDKDYSHPSEKALANFVNAWKKENWSEMVQYTQKSQNETANSLENMFGNTEVVGFEIINKTKNPDDYVKDWYSIEFKVNIKPMISHKGIQTKNIKANVINENGHWGVNATSATGGLYN